MIWMTLALVTLAPTHWKQNINKNKNRIQAHNKILLQPLLRRRDKGTQYRRNFVICTRSDDDRRMDNHRERQKQLEMFKDCNNKKVMSLCKGRDSLLIPYTDTLLSFIFELRETGMPVSTTMVLMKAAQVCHDFHEKTREAQVSITKQFAKVHRMVH